MKIRTFDENGKVSDSVKNGGIKPGEIFLTKTGRKTIPYPKQKSQKYASKWLINNAVKEAQSRNDDFNEFLFSNITLLKKGELTVADSEVLNTYLFSN